VEAANNPEFWNRAAGTRQFTHPLDREKLTRRLPRDVVILDFGCGQGRASRGEPNCGTILAEFEVEAAVELDAKTMNGNPTKILQPWARA
jgi:hypothetical protein